ncbi:MAG: hypothetical protein LUF33_00015 [Clostridiales bacterium]|nr:hypothetical protein [Clostridiales bacterium]
MKAIKGNKAYRILTEAEAKGYRAQGFDIYDDSGKIKERAAGSTVSADEYEALKRENAKLKKENARLKSDTPKAQKE